jgi:RsiW-degrading membrane proteinase PrsW (M82 family)
VGKKMRLDIARLARATNLATVGILLATGVFLVSSPLHPQVGDSHRGMMAVFPGVLLLIFALLIHAMGRWSSRRGSVACVVAILVSVAAIITVLALSSG